MTAPDAQIATERLCAIASLEPEPAGETERLMLGLTGSRRTFAVPFCTEAGLFQERGLSTVVCGPGDIAQARQPNEFIEASQLVERERVLSLLVAELARA